MIYQRESGYNYFKTIGLNLRQKQRILKQTKSKVTK